MSFGIALSGLNAAQQDLNVTANNIANSSTTGFKQSRAEFSDMFAVSPYGVNRNATGNGVKVASVSQQFTQGNINTTNNSMDLALSGQGFFILSDGGSTVYSRAGAFRPNNDGYVVNSQGQRLQVYPDSFDQFHALKSQLYKQGFLTAARPMPAGRFMGGSPRGTRSAAE